MGYVLNAGKEKALRKAFSFEELLHRFEENHLITIRPNTVRRYKVDIEYRIKKYFAYYKLDNIDQNMVETFKTYLLKTLSPKSTNNCLALLKTIFKKGVEWKMIDSSPADLVTLQKIPDQKYIWWEDPEDIKKFLNTAKNCPYYLAYRLALDLGMRLGEIVGLTKGDIDLTRRQIHIHRQWLEKEKCYGPTKHGRERFLNYSEDSELGDLLAERLKEKKQSNIFFITKNNNRIGSRKLSGYHFLKWVNKANVPKVRFHDLRHTFASWYMITNDNIWNLKAILGHADVQTTQKYAHLSKKYQEIPVLDWN